MIGNTVSHMILWGHAPSHKKLDASMWCTLTAKLRGWIYKEHCYFWLMLDSILPFSRGVTKQ